MRVTLTLTPGRHPTPGGVPAAGTPAASVEVAASQNSRTERLRRFAVAFSLDTTPSPMSQAATSWLTAPSLFRTGRAPWFHHPAYAIALPLRRRPGRDPDERLGRRVGGRRGLQADAPGVEAAKHLGRVARQEGALRGGGAPLEVVEQARAARVVEPDPGRHEAEAQVRGRGVPARRHVVGRRVPHRLRHAYSPLRRVPGSRSGAPRTSSGGPPGCSTRAPPPRIPRARPDPTLAPPAPAGTTRSRGRVAARGAGAAAGASRVLVQADRPALRAQVHHLSPVPVLLKRPVDRLELGDQGVAPRRQRLGPLPELRHPQEPALRLRLVAVAPPLLQERALLREPDRDAARVRDAQQVLDARLLPVVLGPHDEVDPENPELSPPVAARQPTAKRRGVQEDPTSRVRIDPTAPVMREGVVADSQHNTPFPPRVRGRGPGPPPPRGPPTPRPRRRPAGRTRRSRPPP